jgi:hypothetical protein
VPKGPVTFMSSLSAGQWRCRMSEERSISRTRVVPLLARSSRAHCVVFRQVSSMNAPMELATIGSPSAPFRFPFHATSLCLGSFDSLFKLSVFGWFCQILSSSPDREAATASATKPKLTGV